MPVTSLPATINYRGGNRAISSVQQSVTTVAALTTPPADAETAVIQFEGTGRFAIGSNPSASVGFLVASGSILVLEGPEDIAAFRAIAEGATTLKLNVIYSKQRFVN